MKMMFVLLVMNGNGGTPLPVAFFPTKEQCVQAMDAAVSHRDGGNYHSFVCAPSNNPALLKGD